MFAKVKEFRMVNGNFVFPHKSALSAWAIEQRILRRTKQLDAAHERALNEIAFDWDPINNRWERMFRELVDSSSYTATSMYLKNPANTQSSLHGLQSNASTRKRTVRF